MFCHFVRHALKSFCKICILQHCQTIQFGIYSIESFYKTFYDESSRRMYAVAVKLFRTPLSEGCRFDSQSHQVTIEMPLSKAFNYFLLGAVARAMCAHCCLLVGVH